ncbi:hypothetical protein [Chitinimonas lacunae]|uniref:Uncharacterized protein n=1 Tax=Chitinimonas lacunae TaxID=1963018 RepID=A0ABV8MJY6_9NEIS
MKHAVRPALLALLSATLLTTPALAGRNPADGEVRYMQLDCKILPSDAGGVMAQVTAPYTNGQTTNLLLLKVMLNGSVYEVEKHLTAAVLQSLRSETGYRTPLPKGGESCKAEFKAPLPISAKPKG